MKNGTGWFNVLQLRWINGVRFSPKLRPRSQ